MTLFFITPPSGRVERPKPRISGAKTSKPSRAKTSMRLYAGFPGTWRSKLSRPAVVEPCAKTTTGLPVGLPTYFSQT